MLKAVVLVAFLGALVTGQLALGGPQQATTWNVAVGEQSKPPAGTPKGTTLNQFFPARLQVNAGDKVTFTDFGFHTVTYLGSSAPQPGFIPDPAKSTYAGINDDAGQPFYFNGMTKFIYNVGVFAPAGPKTISGKIPASSGAIFAQNPKKPAKVTYAFPQAGTFTMVCNIHPGMKMNVVVRPKGASVQSAEAVAARIKAETDAAWAKAKRLASARVPKGTVTMGVGGKTAILDFLPALTTVQAGTTVRFVNRSPSEIHNVALGPLKYMDRFMKQNDLFPMGPNAPNQVTPVFVYGTDPKGTPYDGANHGNGFFATAVADGARGGLPNSMQVTFTKPGKYHFICLLHGPDMAADIRVTK